MMFLLDVNALLAQGYADHPALAKSLGDKGHLSGPIGAD